MLTSHMSPAHPSSLSGVWLPLVTPFKNGAVDLKSYERLLHHYLLQGLTGLVPLGTTGESPTLNEDEMEALVELTTKVVGDRLRIYVGVGGNATEKVIQTLQRLERYPFEGILSVCPYYNRPTEDGIRQHFERIAEATDRRIVIYNIPYRTGVNLSNDAMLALAKLPNVVGIKDCCANLAQSTDLLKRRPTRLSVLTGEDALFYTTLALGGDGGILASAHYRPGSFVEVFEHMAANDHRGAHAIWSSIEPAVRVFFKEPNPMPIKHWLWRRGLIDSAECRLPLTKVSGEVAQEINALEANRAALEAAGHAPREVSLAASG
jgi:4-hydroxy-tetrahydrodipicolinate synthase